MFNIRLSSYPRFISLKRTLLILIKAYIFLKITKQQGNRKSEIPHFSVNQQKPSDVHIKCQVFFLNKPYFTKKNNYLVENKKENTRTKYLTKKKTAARKYEKILFFFCPKTTAPKNADILSPSCFELISTSTLTSHYTSSLFYEYSLSLLLKKPLASDNLRSLHKIS